MKKQVQVALPANQDEEDYLRARRVNSLHQNFMREVVVPARKETT